MSDSVGKMIGRLLLWKVVRIALSQPRTKGRPSAVCRRLLPSWPQPPGTLDEAQGLVSWASRVVTFTPDTLAALGLLHLYHSPP
jgi:hypothetical protein